MRLTSILEKDLEDLGLYLEEDEHHISLKHGEDVIARWWSSGARLAAIRNAARSWAKRHDKQNKSGK